jgi:hypothetical protein
MDRRHPARLIRHAAQRTCRRSMRTATAALGTTMSRPSSLAGSHRVSLLISSQGAAKDCALPLTWSGRAAENAGLLKRQHRSRSQRRFPEDALVANVGCRRSAAYNWQRSVWVKMPPLRSLQGARREACSGGAGVRRYWAATAGDLLAGAGLRASSRSGWRSIPRSSSRSGNVAMPSHVTCCCRSISRLRKKSRFRKNGHETGSIPKLGSH